MRREIVALIAKQFWTDAFKSRATYVMIFLVSVILTYAAYSGWKNYATQSDIRTQYQEEARKSWEENPDKHPHRMAHFGSFAFRLKHPLSLFDFGMESFVGNAVFLEAHKQNTVNFSEASFSTGLLRFGEISLAMLLQVLLPLILFFLGFGSIAVERENGTLKISIAQGARWMEILVGKSLGLMKLALLFFLPVAVVILLLLLILKGTLLTTDELLRYVGTVVSYLLFFQVICFVSTLVSAFSKTSKDALVKLLALWLFFVIILPKTSQALGSYFYPSPSKIEFETILEKELIKKGDSHNPDDPYYKALKDSVLLVHKVDSVHKLPFNYSGFVMREGERTSAEIYKKHHNELLKTFQKQNNVTRFTALFNPYVAIRNASMALAGTDFGSYVNFQEQSESYRYQLAQEMNELQMELISNISPDADEEPHMISKEHWEEFPDFKHQFLSISTALQNEMWSVIALLFWSMASVILSGILSKKMKTI
ncbi:MAG: DUF3526 domain-containing protein [Cyclobacteriaceae bacterium]